MPSKATVTVGALAKLRELATRIASNMLERPPEERLFYRGVQPVSADDLSSAINKRRPNSLPGSEWWTDNPMIAASYGPFVRQAELSRAPMSQLEAGGRAWDEYFLLPAESGRGYSVRAGLRPGAFRTSFEDPAQLDVLIRAIQDQGPHSWPGEYRLQQEFEDLTGLPASWGSSLFVKPKSDIIRPRAPALKKQRGGLAHLKECTCG